MIEILPELPFTFSQLLYGIGIILVGVGFVIFIKGIKKRSKSRPKREWKTEKNQKGKGILQSFLGLSDF